jgi:hypothetical protein
MRSIMASINRALAAEEVGWLHMESKPTIEG